MGWRRSGVWGDNNGSIYTIGQTESWAIGSYDIALVKWNSTNGNKIWNETWGGTGWDSGYGIIGNKSVIYTTGYTKSFGAGEEDIVLIKWNTIDGSIIQNKTWGTNQWERGYALTRTDDAIYTTGCTNSYSVENEDIVLVRWDLNCTPEWHKTYGGGNDDFANAITYNEEQNALYIAGTYKVSVSQTDIIMLKYALNGTLFLNQRWNGATNTYNYGEGVGANGTSIFVSGSSDLYEETDLVLLRYDGDEYQYPPDAPTIATSSQSMYPGDLLIEWNNVYSATSYNLYVNGSVNATIVGINSTTISLNTVGIYGISVTALNSVGESQNSSEILITVENIHIPDAPTIATSSQSMYPGDLLIEWNNVDGATSYNLYVNGSVNATIVGINSTTISLNTVGIYGISVTALNSSGESQNSSEILITVENIPIPDAPTIATSSQSIYPGDLLIEWNNVDGATSYNLYLNGTVNATIVGINSTTVSLNTVGIYRISVSALNPSGESQNSSEILITVENIPIPDTPVLITTNQTIKVSTIMIQWELVTWAENYNVYVNGTLNVTVGYGINQALISLNTSGKYIIEVSAQNEMGVSGKSTPIEIIVDISSDNGAPGNSSILIIFSILFGIGLISIPIIIYTKRRLEKDGKKLDLKFFKKK